MNMDIRVVTVKGQVCNVNINLDDTVAGLKRKISSHMHGQKIAEMKLSYRAKYLSKDEATLRQCGFGNAKGKQVEQVFVAARFVGGSGHRSAVKEIAVQLKYVINARLYGLEEIFPEDEFTWNLMLRGPKGSPYDKGRFSITFRFPQDYPFGAPDIIFNTPIYHPNVFSDGRLCWHANDTNGSTYFADALIGAVNILLVDPNPDSPANGEAARLFVNDRADFIRRARQHTAQHAAWYDM